MHRLRAIGETRVYAKTSNPGRAVFVSCAQARTASSENAFGYDGGASGQTIYHYVGGNPLKYGDPLGLDAEMCTRLFYPFPSPAVRHCFIRFNGDDTDTSSFDPSGEHPDPAPSWWPKSCSATKGSQDDNCVKTEMKKCQADQYDFTGFNCCHCAEQALKACGLYVPRNKWPNWPANPGPQPGEPGYKR